MFLVNERVIGETIRSIREQKGLSLTAAAAAAGITKGALSKIEKAQVSAPVSTLLEIAKALGVHLSRFFPEPEEKPGYVLVRNGEAPLIARGGSAYGYDYHALALGMPDKQAEPFILTMSPGDKKGEFRHGGEEFIYILEGKMAMTLEGEEFILEEGDSLYFDPTRNHICAAHGNEPVRMICVFIQTSSMKTRM